MDGSLGCPPAIQNRRAGNGRSWVLVDSIARIGYRRNATTAGTLTSRRFTVEVSFELVDPPRVSLCFVHCAGRDESHFIGNPLILSAAQAFLLLVITFTGGATHDKFHDYFVYKAGPGRPRLDRIPIPYPRDFEHKRVGILPLADGVSEHYAVVIPDSSYNHRACSMKFNLKVFWSKSKTWTTKEALLARDSETDYLKAVSHQATGVISLGGGVLGWVDLWWGILLCNVLDESPLMRLMQWPVPEPSFELFEFVMDLNHISPRPFRDVTVINGLIKFVELKSHEHTANRGWTATIWSRMVSSLDWHKSSTVHSDDISIANSALMSQVPLLLPEIFDEEAQRLTWDQVICFSPTLSLTNDDVLHIMVSAKSESQIARHLLVVNIRNKMLEALEQYHTIKMMLLEPTYIASAFPGYLGMAACDVFPAP